MLSTYLYVDLRYSVIAVLVYDTLSSFFEFLDDIIMPPLHQVPILVILTAWLNITHISSSRLVMLMAWLSITHISSSHLVILTAWLNITQTSTVTVIPVYIHTHIDSLCIIMCIDSHTSCILNYIHCMHFTDIKHIINICICVDILTHSEMCMHTHS